MLKYINHIVHEYMNACPCVKKTNSLSGAVLYNNIAMKSFISFIQIKDSSARCFKLKRKL